MITLEIQRLSGNETRNVSRAGVVDGACPGCGAEAFLVRAVRLPVGTCREMGSVADLADYGGVCRSCGDDVGYLRVEPDTIFGAEEDRAVIEFARGRVYR